MVNGQDNESVTLTAPWRWGPSPLLTGLAVSGGLLEIAILFWRKPMELIRHEFVISCIVFGIFFFWLSLVWGTWFLLRSVHRRTSGRSRFVGFAGIALLAVLLVGFYLLCWGNFVYTGVFPDKETVQFLASGSVSEFRFILSVLEQTIPNVALYGLGMLGLLFVTMPYVLRTIMCKRWKPRRLPGQGAAALLAWSFTGLACLFFGGLALNDPDPLARDLAWLRIRTQMHPAVSLFSSPQAGRMEEIPKEIDVSLLRPITTPDLPLSGDLERLAGGPNVLYLAVESLRADMVGRVHQGQVIMPNLTALAERSVQFTRATSQSTHTDYCITSYLVSQYPMRSLRHFHPRPDHEYPKTFIHDWLKRYGYSTAIITSDNTDWCDMFYLMFSPELDVFFDSRNLPAVYSPELKGYVKADEPPSTRGETMNDEATVDYASKWAADQVKAGKPFFLHTMFQQTHFAYTVPENFEGPFQPSALDFKVSFDAVEQDKIDVFQNAYFNAARYVDDQLGRLLDNMEELGVMDNTIIILVGDHGEGFLEHNLITHSRIPYAEFNHVPTLIYLPPALAEAQGSPRLESYPVEQIDMAPTLCGLLDIPPAPEFQGIDVLAKDRPAVDNRYTFTHVEVPGQASAECVVYAGRWKLISDRRSGMEHLFDLENDPGETTDLKQAEPGTAAKLREKLRVWRMSHLSYYRYNMYYEHYLPPKI